MTERQSSLFDMDTPTPKQRTYHVQGGHLTAEEFAAGTTRAATQEERVAGYFLANPGQRFTAWDVSRALDLFIVSTRRAISNLCRAGVLVHHRADRREGDMGDKCTTWSAAK